MLVNRDLIAERLGFKRSDIDMLLAMFSKNATSSLKEMQQMIDENNMQGIADAAHAIKGSAGNLKLDDIYDLAMTIETAAKNSENADYRLYYQQLKALLELF
ncbi:MAG: Hpt domain-containing protein [Sulfurimonadaceae bacterium]